MMATTTRSAGELFPPASRALVEQLRRLVDRSGRRWKQLIVLETVSLAVSAPLAYLWLIFFIDNRFHLPVLGRFLASLLFLGGVAWLAVRLVRRWRNLRLTEDEIALAMERHTPGRVENRLINAVQIAREGRPAHPDLSDAVVEENCQRLQQIELQQAAEVRPALLRLALAVALVGIGLLFWIAEPAQFGNAATRFLLPFADVDPIYRTRLTVEPGNVEAIGDVTIRVKIHGERPETLTVLRNVNGRRSSEAVAVPSGNGVVTYTLRGIEQSQTYAVRGGDFTSPFYRITVPRETTLRLLRATYRFPEYTRLPDRTVESAGGDLEALQGTRARVTFVFDRPADRAALLLDGPSAKKRRLELTRVNATEFRGDLVFQGVTGYTLETRQGQRPPHRSMAYALRVLTDQEPKLELSGLEQRGEVQLESVLPLKIAATDDYGLEKVGLFLRRPPLQETRPAGDADGWQALKVWPAGGRTALRQTFELAVSDLKASEGDRLELALRGIDTDPLKKGRWTTGNVYRLVVGGEGVFLQLQYEQIVRTEAELKSLLQAQRQVLAGVAEWVRKLDGQGGLRWDDPKNIAALHAAVKEQGRQQQRVRATAGRVAREMVAQAGNLRLAVGMLADTEMIRAIRILDSVPTRGDVQTRRSTLAEARTTQERTLRSLQEILEQYAAFRSDWELSNMIPFTKMLADRQAKLRDQSRRHASQAAGKSAELQAASASRRQAKVLDLCQLIQPAFTGLGERLKEPEPILSGAFAAGATTLGSDAFKGPLRRAVEETKAGQWSLAAQQQTVAAAALADLYVRLRKAQVEAARQVLAALREKAKTDLEAQKALARLKEGSNEAFVKEFPSKLKVEEIIRLREIVDRKRNEGGEEGKMLDKALFGEVDPAQIELKQDSGVRQDPNILQLGDSRPKTIKYPTAMDTKQNKVKPFIQEKFEDLVGKLLEEADELGKDYQTLTLSTNQNNNDPGEVSKQGGRLNSTGAVAATGNKKPPTSNHGGVSRTGRQGARAYGMVIGKEGVNRRGREKPLEGQEKAADQAGTIKMKKSDDMQKETSTGIGGRKVESDDTHFSLSDAGKWTDDMAKRMDKPQKKNAIVERQGGKLDPRVAALLRDLTSKQEQVIERLKAIRKELKNLYLPTDHLDDLMKTLTTNLQRLKERPDAELFRVQMETLDRLRRSVKVFRAANAGFQPSVPRRQVIRGRVLDEPSRQAIPGYEEAVKRYYQKLAAK
jgi:hypothetical protein